MPYSRPMCAARRRPTLGCMYDGPALDRSELIRRAAAFGLAATGTAALQPGTAAAARRGLTYRGITYDTGIDLLGGITRVRWSRALMEGEIDAICTGLRCSAVSLAGTHVPRLVQTAEAALARGLHVMIQPRMYDRPQTAILDHLARTAREAERLRKRYPGRVTLITGCEHPLFTPGIVPGEKPGGTFLDRIALLGKASVDWTVLRERLNAFLGRAAAVARADFGGDVTYAAAVFEQVDWTPFDIVGLDYYEFHRDRAGHAQQLARYRRWNKPILICEFGSCTYVGAPRRGGCGVRHRRLEQGAAGADRQAGAQRGRPGALPRRDARRLRVARSARRVRVHVHLARRPKLDDAEARPGHRRVLGREGRRSRTSGTSDRGTAGGRSRRSTPSPGSTARLPPAAAE